MVTVAPPFWRPPCPQPTTAARGRCPGRPALYRPLPSGLQRLRPDGSTAPPQDPPVGSVRCGSLTVNQLATADREAGKRGSNFSPLPPSLSCRRASFLSRDSRKIPRRGLPTLETGGGGSRHFSFPGVMPVSRLCSLWLLHSVTLATWRNDILGTLGPGFLCFPHHRVKSKRRDCKEREMMQHLPHCPDFALLPHPCFSPLPLSHQHQDTD